MFTTIVLRGKSVEVPGSVMDGVYCFPILNQGTKFWQAKVMLQRSGAAAPSVLGWELAEGDLIDILDKHLTDQSVIDNVRGLYYADGGAIGSAPRKKMIPKALEGETVKSTRKDACNQFQQSIIKMQATYNKKIDASWLPVGETKKSSLILPPHLAMQEDKAAESAMCVPNGKRLLACQVKLDGRSMLAALDVQKGKPPSTGTVLLYGRSSKIFNGAAYDKIRAELKPRLVAMFCVSVHQTLYLTGEIFLYGVKLNTIMSSAATTRTSVGSHALQYHIYDCFYADCILPHKFKLAISCGVSELKPAQYATLVQVPIPGIKITAPVAKSAGVKKAPGTINVRDLIDCYKVNWVLNNVEPGTKAPKGTKPPHIESFVNRQVNLDRFFKSSSYNNCSGMWSQIPEADRVIARRWFAKKFVETPYKPVDSMVEQCDMMNLSVGANRYFTTDKQPKDVGTAKTTKSSIYKVVPFLFRTYGELETIFSKVGREKTDRSGWAQEGLILHRLDGAYVSSNEYSSSNLRSGWKVKKKVQFEEKYIVVDFEDGAGRNAGAIKFIMQTKAGNNFKATPMDMTIEEQKALYIRAMKNRNTVIGKLLQVKFYRLTGSKKVPSHANVKWTE